MIVVVVCVFIVILFVVIGVWFLWCFENEVNDEFVLVI